MKLANLWFFFYNAGGIPVIPVTPVDQNADSRSWFHRSYRANATPKGFEIHRLPVRIKPVVSAGATVRLIGSSLGLYTGFPSTYTDTIIPAIASSPGSSVSLQSGRTTVRASAVAALYSVTLKLATGFSTSSGNARIQARGSVRRLQTGQVGVVIGPDRLKLDEEEVLLLLEVA